MSPTRGNAGKVNLHRIREAPVGTAIADRKEECRTADQFYCGEIFFCNSDSSKSTEAFSNSLARGGSRRQQYCQNSTDRKCSKRNTAKLTFCSLSRYGTDLLTIRAHPCSVASRNEPLRRDITDLKAEMAKARVARSAARRLVQIDNLRGYECSICTCRFPETCPPPGRTRVESRRIEKEHREREFSHHVCSERGW